MERDEAIDRVLYLNARFTGEFCVTVDEISEESLRTYEALKALGVTDEEILAHG